MISKSITSSISRSIASSISSAGDSGVSISESFEKSDGTGLGPDLTWRTYEETWRTTSGRAKTTSNGSATAYATKSLGSPRHNAEVVVVAHDDSNDNVGVMLRNDGSTDVGYAIVFQRTGTTTARIKISTRSGTSFSDVTGWVVVEHPNATFRLAGSADGDTIKGFIDGYEVISVTDSTIPTGDYAGIYTSVVGNTFESFSASNGSFGASTPVHIFGVAGQSNNLREGKVSELPSRFVREYDHSFIWNGSAFEKFSVGVNHQDGGISADLTDFGYTVGLAYENEFNANPVKQYFCMTAEGATNLATDWADASSLRNTFYTELGQAIAALPTPYYKGILSWNQGQRDSADATNAGNYGTNLEAFFDDFDTDIGEWDKVVFLMSENGEYTHEATVRGHQVTTVAAESNRYSIADTYFRFDEDHIHYGTAGQMQAGSLLYRYDNQSTATKYSDAEEITGTSGLNVGSNDYTIALTAKFTEGMMSQPEQTLGGKWNGEGSEIEQMLRWDGDTRELKHFYSLNGSTTTTRSLSIPDGLPDGVLFSLRLEHDHSDPPAKVYVDDVLVGTIATNGSAINSSSANWFIGTEQNRPHRTFCGVIPTFAVTVGESTTNLRA